MVLVVFSLGTVPPGWGKYSFAEWKVLSPMANCMYIKRARSYRPKTSATGTTGTATGTTGTATGTTTGTTTATTGTTGTTTDTTTPEEGHLVYLHRARIVGHASVFAGNVPKLMETLPCTDALCHVHMVGPFTKEEKVLAVDPLRFRSANARRLFNYMTTYNKSLADWVSRGLDESAMTALQQSLVDANVECVPGDGVALHEDDRAGQPSASGELMSDSSPVTYIGTNLLVTDHTSSGNADLGLDDEEEPAVADESANQPNEAGIQEDDDLAAFFEQYDHCEGDEENGDEDQQAADARTAREEAHFEAIAYRVCSNYLICSKPYSQN